MTTGWLRTSTHPATCGRNGRGDGSAGGPHRAAGHGQGSEAELPGDVRPAEDAVPGEVVGAGRSRAHGAGHQGLAHVVLVDELDRQVRDRRGNRHR
jgi:hypothetical protein